MAKFVTGLDCDAWCTRCKMDLAHTIVAMVGGLPKRVECNTCHSLHNYHLPRSGPPAKGKSSRARSKATGGGSRRSTGSSRVASTASPAVREIWGQRMAASEDRATQLYSFRESYGVDDVLEHPTFGRGVVVKLLTAQKIRVLFQDGEHMLAMGR